MSAQIDRSRLLDSAGDRLARRQSALALVFAGLLAALAVAIAVSIADLAQRYVLAIAAAMTGLAALPLLGTCRRARDVLVITMALGTSVGFSISFFHYVDIPGRYAPLMAAAQAVTISLTMVAMLAYVATRVFERWFYLTPQNLRLYPLLVWPSVLFMLAGVLSLANAAEPRLSLLELARLAYLLCLTIVFMNLTRREVRIYLFMLGANAIVQAALAAMQYVSGSGLGLGIFGEAHLVVQNLNFGKVARPTGTIGDPNILAYMFEIIAPVLVALMFAARTWFERLWFMAAAAAALCGTIVTLSRAAWVMEPLTMGFVLFASQGRRLLSLRMVAVVLGAAIVIGVAGAYFYPVIERRLLGDDGGSTRQRMPLNMAAVEVALQVPVLGVGLNNFAVTFTSYDLSGDSRVLRGIDFVVHNMYLLMWAEIGTIGLLAFLWFFGAVFVAAWRLRRADAWTRTVALGIAAGIAAHMGHGMVDPGFKLNLTVSQLMAAQIGLMGWLALNRATTAALHDGDADARSRG